MKPQPTSACAYYGRVSTPKQKIEHQREHVFRFCETHNIHIPAEFKLEDVGKRHRADKRPNFQMLLDYARQRKVDWIIVASFDRWGVSDVDEFFEFRRALKKTQTHLWSVVDNCCLTSCEEGDYYRIVSLAVASSRYCEQMAEKNVLKMIEMIRNGWWASGSAPYGTDLVCYTLAGEQELFRVIRLDERHANGKRITRVKVVKPNGEEEVSSRFPLRDKKATGYKLRPSVVKERLKAVNLLFEYFANGMGLSEMSKTLLSQGVTHYGSAFQDHAITTILSNPAYIGLPTWGKVGTGAYRVLRDLQPARPNRNDKEAYNKIKTEKDWIQPFTPQFPPIVPVELWETVQEKLKAKIPTNPNFRKRRTKSITTHPLNGKMVCPDCEQVMVLGSSMVKGKEPIRCFNCGLYRRSGRQKCFSNSVRFDKLDWAVEQLLEQVKDRIQKVKDLNVGTLMEEEWLKRSELGKIIREMFLDVYMPERKPGQRIVLDEALTCLVGLPGTFEWLLEDYLSRFNAETGKHKAELEENEKEIQKIGDLLEKTPSELLRERWSKKLGELEERRRELKSRTTPIAAKARAIQDQLTSIQEEIALGDKRKTALLLDSFLEKVVVTLPSSRGWRRTSRLRR